MEKYPELPEDLRLRLQKLDKDLDYKIKNGKIPSVPPDGKGIDLTEHLIKEEDQIKLIPFGSPFLEIVQNLRERMRLNKRDHA